MVLNGNVEPVWLEPKLITDTVTAKYPGVFFPLTRLGAGNYVTSPNGTPGDSFVDVMTIRAKSSEREKNAWLLG